MKNKHAATTERTRQRGVLMVTTPLLMLLIVLLGALALDGARLYSLRAEMQSVANTAATAAANLAQACGGRSVDQDGWEGSLAIQAENVVKEKLNRLGGSLSVTPGIVESDGDKVLGFRPYSATVSETNAVRVVYEILNAPVSSLLPEWFGTVDMKAVAVAKKEVVATISAAGSTAIVGGSGENAGLLGTLLGQILGVSDFALDATSIESLAKTTFNLGKFLKDIGVAGGLVAVNDLVGVNDILHGVLAGLESGSSAAATIQSLLEDSGLVKTNVRLDEVIKLVSGVEYPDETPVPVYDTVVALALNTLSGVVDVSRNVNIGLGDALQLDLSLSVNTPPSVAVGPARMTDDGVPMTSFNAADIVIGLVIKTELLGLLDVTIPLLVETGGGKGYLDSAVCAAGSANNTVFMVRAFPKIASVSTSLLHDDGSTEVTGISAEILPGLGEVLLSLVVTASIPSLDIGKGSPNGVLLGPMDIDLYEQASQSETVTSELGLQLVKSEISQTLEINVETPENCGLLGLGCLIDDVLGPILDGLTGTLSAALEDGLLELVGNILNGLLAPLLSSLGLHLGGMTVSVTNASQGGVILLDCDAGDCDLID